VIGLYRAIRERLWERVVGMSGRAPKGIPTKKPNAEWIKPGLVGHVRFLKGEGGLRHATLTEVREDLSALQMISLYIKPVLLR
jgi:ATP-dependent DNA ligase